MGNAVRLSMHDFKKKDSALRFPQIMRDRLRERFAKLTMYDL